MDLSSSYVNNFFIWQLVSTRIVTESGGKENEGETEAKRERGVERLIKFKMPQSFIIYSQK